MKIFILLLTFILFDSSFAFADEKRIYNPDTNKWEYANSSSAIFTSSNKKCRVNGLKKGTHKKLRAGLCKLSRVYGVVEVTSSCRSRKTNRGVRNSQHLYKNSCRAADIRIKGVRPSTILKWWTNNIGGGVGHYCSAKGAMSHVDVWKKRSWKWKCRRR